MGSEGNPSVQREVAAVLGRGVMGVEERERGGKSGRGVWTRLGESQVDVEELIGIAKGLSGFGSAGGGGVSLGGGGGREIGEKGGQDEEEEKREMTRKIEGLEKELEGLRKGLGRAKGVNERIWKGVVEGAMSK